MRTKKCGLIAATAAVLLVTALLVTTCEGSFNLGGLAGRSTTGTLQLSLGGMAARTIMPASSEWTIAGYEITVTADGTTPAGATTGTHYVAYAAGNVSLTLSQGNYEKVEVKAYKTFSAPSTVSGLIAEGESTTAFAVTGGTNAAVAVTIDALSDGVGTGTFSWDFNAGFGTGATGATMTIVEIGGSDMNTGTTTFDDDVFATPTGSIAALPSGFYDVVIVIAGGAKFRNRTISEVLHVYENTTSDYTPAAYPALVQYRYDVDYWNVFTDDSGGAAWGTPVNNLAYAATIPNAPTPPNPTTDKDPSFTDWNGPFQGWFTEDGSATPFTQWGTQFIHTDEIDLINTTATPVVADTTLYARYAYTAATAQSFTITFTAPGDLFADITLTPSGIATTGTAPNWNIPYATFAAGGGQTLVIAFTGATVTDSRYTIDANPAIIPGTGASISIPFSALDGIGLYQLGISVQIGGTWYSGQASITITGLTP